MERRKLTKEDLDKVRDIEGFPIGKDEDIIALSDPPYYTACPNPFITDFIKEHGRPYDEATDDYHREPFATDVSEGKTDPIYNAHSYHTKVPYRAIMRYILHYTTPGDIVFDGFCGSGMTGVAAKMCGASDEQMMRSLTSQKDALLWGGRYSVLADLSPAATFISHNFNTPLNYEELTQEANRILDECKDEYGWMYQTEHTNGEREPSLFPGSSCGIVNYIVWSDVLICPNCGIDVVFWDVALDPASRKIRDAFQCPECSAIINKRDCQRAQEVFFDDVLGETIASAKQIPVLINYTFAGKRFEKKPDEKDFLLIKKINNGKFRNCVPCCRMPEGQESRRNDKYGITHIHHFFTKRTLCVLSALWEKALQSSMPDAMQLILTGIMQISSKQSAFRYDSRNTNNTAGGILKGTLYIPSVVREGSVFSNFERRLASIQAMALEQKKYPDSFTIIQTASATDSGLPASSIDYVFTDPPFGNNINYSELSFMWEAWIKVFTNNKEEAIMNDTQHKSLLDYQGLMEKSFLEYYRVLKPNRWITVEFHNSQNAVWNAIREALQKSGFIIADVRILDKKQWSFKQVNNTSAVKQDLVISAYKPRSSFQLDFLNNAGTVETAWSFTHQHLEYLPVAVVKNSSIEIVTERQSFMLFDRMVAYHIINGIPVPIDAADFYCGLDERYLKRDGMYFLPDQINEYDTARIKNDIEPIQFELFVTNEKSAIAWLYQQLSTPQTYAEIQPKFMQEIKTIDKFEDMPELAILLEENFLQKKYGKWYIPDVTKEADVARLRDKKLLKEFEGYLATKGKLKLFRAEAVRVGFAKLWADKNYKLIVETAERLPDDIIQEDDKLLMYYDISLGRL